MEDAQRETITIEQILKNQVKKTDSDTNYLQDYFPDCEIQYKDTEKWLKYLKDYGVVVVKGVLSDADMDYARTKYWDKIESLGKIKRDDITTWIDENWPSTEWGFTTGWGISYCESAWFLRTHPNVMGCFKSIWNSNDLISSFDTFLTWRPWWLTEETTGSKEKWPVATGGLHCDQNPFFRPGYTCVQGMIPLYEVNE